MDRSGPFSILPSGTSARDATRLSRTSVLASRIFHPTISRRGTNTLICTHPVHCDVARGTHRPRLPAGDAVQYVPPLLFPLTPYLLFFFPDCEDGWNNSCTCWQEGRGYAMNFRGNIKLRWVGRSFDPPVRSFPFKDPQWIFSILFLILRLPRGPRMSDRRNA